MGDWLAERRIVDEVVNRAVDLAAIHTEPVCLSTGADAGSRLFMVGDWKFEVRLHTSVYYSSTLMLGEVKRVQVWDKSAGAFGRILVFVYNIEYPPYQNQDGNPWSMSLPACRDVLLPYLRRVMVLDDLAERG